ncbi:hypothetical protein Ancab_001057 [Ancistrocladus abbreviatus]
MDNRERESHDDKMEKGSFASSDHWKALATSGEESELADASVEKIFESREVPPWQKQLTFRAFFVSFILTILFSFIVMKFNLTTGIIPTLNVAAGFLGFFFVKTWTKFLEKSGLLKQPFTRQENTVIQTCVVASSGVAFSVGKKWNRFIPIPMAMAIPFYFGGYFAIDMCVGSLILYVWRRMNKAKADAYGSAVASGLICGDGIWTLPSSILVLAHVKPPICMKFLLRATDARVDAFLQSIKM